MERRAAGLSLNAHCSKKQMLLRREHDIFVPSGETD
jgi:hypothetical protein